MQLTIVFLLACCHFFGPALSQKRQYGGYDVNIRQYPFVVAISLGGQTTGSGAIIAPRWILSSASAFLVPYHDSYKVNVGADAVGGGQWYQGQMVYQHPEWEGFQDNIALLKTNRKIKFGPTAQPIKLFESNPDGIDNALMLSYGENEQGTRHLRAATYSLTSGPGCLASLPNNDGDEVIKRNQGYCQNAPDGTKGQWYDDTGAPIVINDSPRLVAIHAFRVDNDTHYNKVSIAMRVSIYKDFIVNTMKY
uniref:Peptidase S1 domain-containing protein n=1 Tax=Anopheles atroparvus TaxID=41427 RepID=A0AAG5D248_ANOAO